MTFTPIPIGSLGWGAPVNTALADQDARITDIEQAGGAGSNVNGFIAMPYDLVAASAASVLTSGTVTHVRVDLLTPATVSTITLPVFNAGSGLTAGQNFVGLYDSAGTRVAVSADQSASWATNGEKNIALTAPYAAAAGTYYIAMLSNGTTPIGILRSVTTGAVTGVLNHGLTAATARWATGPTAQTTLPASITMASRTPLNTSYWAGLS